MDWHAIAALVSSALTFVSVVPYSRDIFWGTTRPNIISWGLWMLIQIIFTAAQFTSGASWSIVLPGAEVLTVGFITLLCLLGYGYKKYGVLDIICFLCCIFSIVLWQITNEPMIALILSLVADFFATLPTLRKAYFDPESETMNAYILVIASAVFAGVSTTIGNFANLAWPVYIFLVNTLIVISILVGQKLKKRAR